MAHSLENTMASTQWFPCWTLLANDTYRNRNQLYHQFRYGIYMNFQLSNGSFSKRRCLLCSFMAILTDMLDNDYSFILCLVFNDYRSSFAFPQFLSCGFNGRHFFLASDTV